MSDVSRATNVSQSENNVVLPELHISNITRSNTSWSTGQERTNLTFALMEHNSSTNFTVNWTFIPITTVVLSVVGAVLNTFVLLTILSKRSLQTPFSIYIINLLIVNLLRTLVVNTFDVINSVYSTWRYGYSGCTLYLYVMNIVTAVMVSSHLLISFNRVWSILRPFSYRRHHSRRLAFVLCILLWLVANCLLLPQIILDHIYYRKPNRMAKCALNSSFQRGLTVTTHVFEFVIPWLLVIISYPIVYVLRGKRQINNRNSVAMGRVVPFSSATSANGSTRARPSKPDTTKSDTTRKASISPAFIVLTFLTATVAVCWTPIIAYVTIAYTVEFYFDGLYLQTAVALFALAPLLDPIYFSFALQDLRQVIFQSFVRR